MLDKLVILEDAVLGLWDFFLGDSMLEIVNIDPRESNASLKIWVDSAGKCRKVGHRGARVKIEFNGKRLL